MNSLLIAYDRNRQDDYGPLIDELKRMGATKVQYSLWELHGRTDAIVVGQHLQQFLNAGDRLEVVVTGAGRYSHPPRSAFAAFANPHSTVANALAGYTPVGGLGRLIK